MDKIREIVDVPFVSRLTHVNILAVLKEVEELYKSRLDGANRVYNDMDLLRDSTWDDLCIIKGKLRMLRDVHLITPGECEQISDYFSELRSEMLKTAQDNKITEDKDNGN